MNLIKSIMVVAAFVFSLNTNAQNGIIWSAPIEVAPSSFDDRSPRVSLLSDGTPVVIWGAPNKIYFSKMFGSDFIDPIEINTNGISPDIYNFAGIDLATFENKIFIIFEDFSTGIHLVRSDNGGATFELPVSVYDPPAGLWATLPSVSTDDIGNPLVSTIRELPNETEARHILSRSDDGGQTFGPPSIASDPADGEYVCECCPSDIFAKGNDVFVAFRNNNNNLRDMWISRSADGGINFTEATDMDATDWVINVCPISGPKVTGMLGDSLITVWKSGASGNSRVSFSTVHSSSMEKGWEFVFPQTNNFSNQETPEIAGANDTIGVVWQEGGFGANSTDLIFAYSKTGAEGLTNNFANITNAPGTQRRPSLAYKNGFFHLIYSDASGAVFYQKGTVSEVNATNELAEKYIALKLIAHPIKNDQIILENNGEYLPELTLNLFNNNGQLISLKKINNILSGQQFIFEIKNTASGIYFLQATSDNGLWSEKIIIE